MNNFDLFMTAADSRDNEDIIQAIDKIAASPEGLNAADDDGDTIMHLLADVETDKQIQYLHMLLANGASVNVKNHRGRTPLHNAVAYGCTRRVINQMVLAGADINARDSKGRTPVHCVADRPVYLKDAHRDAAEMLEFLESLGANVLANADDGLNALQRCERNRLDISRYTAKLKAFPATWSI